MRRLYIFGLLLLFLAAIAGCESDLPLPQGGGAPRAVVYSELVAGQKVEVRVGKSKPVAPGIDNNFQFTTDATVVLQDKAGNPIETLTYQPDSSNVMGLYAGRTVIEANKSYKLSVLVPDVKEVSAMAITPPPFKVELLDTSRTLLNGRPVLKFHFKVYPLPGVKQYLVMEALKQSVTTDTSFTYQGVRYRKSQNRDLFEEVKNRPDADVRKDSIFENDYLRIPCYTQDENADNNQIGGLNENYNSILFTQQVNKTLTTDFFINATALSSNPAEAIAPVGRVLVYVKSVSRDYYDFLLTYEKVKRNPGLNSLIQAIQLRSNTAGGLGVVGGVYQKVYYLYYDPL